jgi:hypothetical protein
MRSHDWKGFWLPLRVDRYLWVTAAREHRFTTSNARYELISFATEIRLRSERRAGELLRDMPKNDGGRPEKNQSQSATSFSPPTLADLGVTKDQSSKWQKLAALPEDKFEAKVDNAKGRASNASTSAPDLRTTFTGENEWYTPEDARRVLRPNYNVAIHSAAKRGHAHLALTSRSVRAQCRLSACHAHRPQQPR